MFNRSVPDSESLPGGVRDRAGLIGHPGAAALGRREGAATGRTRFAVLPVRVGPDGAGGRTARSG